VIPPVCVIIAAKDAQATIGVAVLSALAQPEASEVIVVDDASTDATGQAARACDDGSGRLVVVRLEQNVGPAAARNAALGLSHAPSVCVLDADDFMFPGRLTKLLAGAEDGALLVADNLLRANAGGETGPYRLLFPQGSQPRLLDLRMFVAADISYPCRPSRELGFLKPLMSRAFLDENGLRYDPRLRLGEDYVLYASALARGARMKLVDACGYVSVEHGDSLSNDHKIGDLRALVAADAELAATDGLTAEDIATIRAHQASVAHRLHHRECLDAKSRKEWGRCVAWALKSPGTTRYIFLETLRAKMPRTDKLLSDIWGRDAADSQPIYPADEDLMFVNALLRHRPSPTGTDCR
jgi:succinoglycan biosynthesis protein ExoU